MKKALIFALSLVLICSLAACGEPDDRAGNTSTDSASTEQSAEPENTPEPASTTPTQPEGNNDASETERTPVPTPQQSGETYEDDPDIPMEVNNPEYDLEALLPELRSWDEMGHGDWETIGEPKN